MSLARVARASIVLLAIAAPMVGWSTVGCQKSSETEAAEAAQAVAIKQYREQQAFKELERGDAPLAARLLVESQEADEHAAREQRDVSDAVLRERRRLHALLTKEMAWTNRWIADTERVALSADGDARTTKERDANAARDWRGRLEQDLEAVDYPPPDADWRALKKRIEHDLEKMRPASVPPSYETPYGI
jgi:hypothetical protein